MQCFGHTLTETSVVYLKFKVASGMGSSSRIGRTVCLTVRGTGDSFVSWPSPSGVKASQQTPAVPSGHFLGSDIQCGWDPSMCMLGQERGVGCFLPVAAYSWPSFFRTFRQVAEWRHAPGPEDLSHGLRARPLS